MPQTLPSLWYRGQTAGGRASLVRSRQRTFSVKLGKKVAGKRLHESLFQSASQETREKMVARFARECKLLQSVKHPNIV